MSTTVRGARSASAPRTAWFLAVVVAILTTILLLQKTKQALLPAKQTPVLWLAEVVTIASAVLLRSGWGRDNRWAEEQARLGTLANNFYEPRRAELISGFAIGVGVLCALWWATATWGVIFMGMSRGSTNRGLLDFMVAALAGAIAGGVFGAAMGLAVGHVWETRHRRKRVARHATHA